MHDSQPEYLRPAQIPDEIRVIADPVTGQDESLVEIWQMGEHNPSVRRAVQELALLNGGVLGPFPSVEDGEITPQNSAFVRIAARLMLESPPSSRVIAVGELASCALRITYSSGCDGIKPREDPGVDAVMREVVGDNYIDVNKKAL